MPGISTNIWFDTQAEESASFEVSVFRSTAGPTRMN